MKLHINHNLFLQLYNFILIFKDILQLQGGPKVSLNYQLSDRFTTNF